MILKKLLFWGLVLLTWYLAGMYRSFPLLVLSVIELLLLVFGSVLCRVFRRRFSMRFARKKEFCVARIPADILIEVKNAGRLPITRFSIGLMLAYQDQDSFPERRTIWGSAAKGTRHETLHLTAPYAGRLCVDLEEERIYDWLSLCSAKRSLSGTLEISVFPPEVPLAISFSNGVPSASSAQQEHIVNGAGSAHQEVRQIREYLPGDSARHIHWNISARSDDLWIREYEKETQESAELFLDIASECEPQVPEMDRFYTLTMSLMLGLLKWCASVHVRWMDADYPFPVHVEATDLDGCWDVLSRLYQAQVPREEAAPVLIDNGHFRLTRDLELYMGSALIYRFSPEDLEREIEDVVLEV